MFLEQSILEILNKKNAGATEISEDLGVKTQKIEDILNRLKSAGILLDGV